MVQTKDLRRVFKGEAIDDVVLHLALVTHIVRHQVAAHPLAALLDLEHAISLLVQIGHRV